MLTNRHNHVSPSACLGIAVALLPLALSIRAAHAQTYTLTTLATFNGTANGSTPESSVTLDSSGNLFGTTISGGANGNGTVFKIAAGTNAFTTLATFNTTNGASPQAGLTLDSGGNIYGTTSGGGASGNGTVFKIAAGTNTLTTLATFTGAANGANPIAGVTLDSSGNIYGTTVNGGASGFGTVFKIAAGTNAFSTLATFTGTANGKSPGAVLAPDSSGNLYGTTLGGGANGDYGTVFKIAAGTNAFTTVVAFNGSNGYYAQSGVTVDSSGNLYGTTLYGGPQGDGNVYKIAAGTSTVTALFTFTGSRSPFPNSGVTLDSSGNLYGTTESGGSGGNGMVFKVAAGTNTLTTIANFLGTSNGATPEYGTLALDSSGNLYGTTKAGGANNLGTVFKLTPTGAAAPEPAALALLLPALPLIAHRGRKRRQPIL